LPEESMEREKIEEVIIDAYNNYLKEQDIEGEGNSETLLFGSDSEVDSMGFVNLIMDVEAYFHDQGHMITLTYEEAMAGESSPFQTVTRLTDYILELIQGSPE
jgi:acyl carrier protein